MFERLGTQAAGGTTAASPAPLCVAELEAFRDRLIATVQAPAEAYDDTARIDAIRALEELGCVVTAAQAKHAADLDASLRSQRAEAGLPAREHGRGIAHQVALVRRESPTRGEKHLGLAKITHTELPHTWTAWSTGRITEWTATVIARETACLSLADRMAVDELVAADPDTLETMTPVHHPHRPPLPIPRPRPGPHPLPRHPTLRHRLLRRQLTSHASLDGREGPTCDVEDAVHDRL